MNIKTLYEQCLLKISKCEEKLPIQIKNDIDSLKNCCYSNSIEQSIKNGHLKCLQQSLFQYKNDNDIFFTSLAAEYGQIECLKFLINFGCSWNFLTTQKAAFYGQLNCLKFAMENGCEYNWLTVINSIHHIECLKYLLDNYVKKDSDVSELFQIATKYGYINCMNHIVKNKRIIRHIKWSVFEACIKGRLDCLKYMYEQNLFTEWDIETTKYIVMHGHLNCLKYVIEHGCQWNQYTTYYAAKNGHLNCLKFALENGCNIHPDTKCVAILNNKNNIIQYLSEIKTNK